ncbi:MAG: cysteine hydrolase [Clostridia bacterium]|nr:cysteine hydrolase [Clostridia bacterium]MBR2417548.1 cysteine hydrolase [Clostridia bacterium]
MKVLCVIDMQNDFIDGALGTKEAEAIVENVKSKIELYRQNGDTVIFTRDTHTEDYMNTQEGKNLPVPHCIKGSKGWEITEKLDTASDKIIDKPTFGSFELSDYVASLSDVEEIELIGLCTDICVISNAMLLKAKLTETQISVDSSCCAGVTPESHLNALESMKMCQINCY